ncbi:chemokine-like receptor 1 [Electrophorus electricus]|uniref:chemokine-like receptor 1 n=1 Tax=Electrophorus electricus TaxID=8005 RepID=UPI0015D047AF|nr:chemokine-like receptor 1 [Electrophorus electricus]
MVAHPVGFWVDSMDFTLDYSNYGSYTVDNLTYEEVSFRVLPTCSGEVLCIALVVINAVIFLLGIIGNGVVICITGLKIKKSVNTTWYLSLAVSDFLFCFFLLFNIFYMATSDWTFEIFICKFMSFIMLLNMFSSIFLLVIISAVHCGAVMVPVWAQNQRTISRTLVMVSLAWVVSAALSVPSIIFRNVRQHLGISRCLNNYSISQYSHETIAISRFLVGFLIPFLIIITCYSIIIFKLIVTFFLCWLPYHSLVLTELNQSIHAEFIPIALRAGTLITSTNIFLNPILYMFMGNDFRRKFKNLLVSKMNKAMGQEGRMLSRYPSRSNSMDAGTSTHI